MESIRRGKLPEYVWPVSHIRRLIVHMMNKKKTAPVREISTEKFCAGNSGETEMAYETYQMVTGTIMEIRDMESDCCAKTISINNRGQEVQFVVSGRTLVINNTMLRTGMRVAAFYDANLPTPAVYPPRYRAEIITMLWRNQSVKLAYFDENLLAVDNSLQLNPDRLTRITTANGQSYNCSPGGADLLVYYTAVTRSLPPITTPQKIIVLCPDV